VEFLNSVANETDPFGLYSPAMASIDSPLVPIGFERFFELRAGFANKPVNQVSFYDALRFVNWMHNGQENGDTETGAYTLVGGTPTPSSVLFESGATLFLPSENEWYKAAYYDPSTASYFDYPAGSDIAITCSAPEATPKRANCGGGDGNLTDVGAYTGSASPYGTFDQGGSVWEWNEQSVASPVLEAEANLLGAVARASVAAWRNGRAAATRGGLDAAAHVARQSRTT
jgi:formylglycine-generating enzyme required for sulfatase activity